MSKWLYLMCCCCWLTCVQATDNERRVRVPKDLTLGDMKIKLTDAAQHAIQKDVDALTSSPKYMEIKADRARLYFPIIEKVFKEEGIPTDFKFLALQESALISDAVSSANAVGFWQFKDFTGREVGLRIDRSVDERLNIVASTHGAAKYFKRHNFYFDNWVYTILAHMTGRGGAEKYVDRSNFGKKRMTLDGKTHWYVVRFLAHKIAYEDLIKGQHTEGLSLVEYTKGKGKSLEDIAKDAKIDKDELIKYNKWLKVKKVPSEKTYSVMLPVRGKAPKMKDHTEKEEKPEKEKRPEVDIAEEELIVVKVYPNIDQDLNVSGTIFIKINGLPCILAKSGDGISVLAQKAGLSPEKFARYNDLKVTEGLKEGEIYYIRPKRNRGKIYYYTVQPKETLWDVSQKFGIKKAKLAKLNRMLTIDDLDAGRVMWLRTRRPASMPVEYRELPDLPVDETISVRQKKVDSKPTPVVAATVVPSETPVVVPDTEVVTPEETTVDEVKVDEEDELNSAEPIEEDQLKEMQEQAEDEVVEVLSELDEPMAITTHVVAKGETLYSIARRTGVSVSDLVEWNSLYDTSLSIGQQLIIHGVASENRVLPPVEQVDFHVVAPGETMYGISKKYGVAVQSLLDMNQKDNFNLDVGEKLRVR